MYAQFQEAVFRVLSCKDTVESVIQDMQLSRKHFKRHLYSHGYTKLLEKPIVLFDLNGTLCFRTDRNRVIKLRPQIKELKKLKKLYRIGVYTSCTRYNALLVCECIEDVCGRLFDRHLIFTREHTIPFTEDELLKYNLPTYKMKKSLNTLFAPEHIHKVTIVDDELIRIKEKDNALAVPGWYGEYDDNGIDHVVSSLLTMAFHCSNISVNLEA